MNNYIVLFFGCISILTISCKNPSVNNSTLSEDRKVDIINDSIYYDCIQIVKDKDEFKWSCAKEYNTCKLSEKYLYLEIIEPINYEIDKIRKSSNGYVVSLVDRSFYYSIELVDSIRGIFYWKCIMPDNKFDEGFSFYAIDKKKSETQHLEKHDCSNENRIENWVGEYTCTIEATDGETNEDIQVTFKLVLTDLTHIEFSNERFKVRIQGDLTDTNRIQGDVAEVIDGKDGFPVTSDPFIVIEKYEDVMLVTCPLITHGPGFGSTPYAFEKIK